MSDFSRAGVNLFTIPATPTFCSSCYYLSKEAWTGPDIYDFSQLDERMAVTLAARPDAYVFPRLNLSVPRISQTLPALPCDSKKDVDSGS